jgi:photosynthetic reaction center H subunit
MSTGAVTASLDVAQLVLYAFWIFFAGLVVYLLRENKREGYPLESDRSNARVAVQGWPAIPRPKTYLLRDGRSVVTPRPATAETTPLPATPAGAWLGAPLVPDGDPLQAGVGPGSWAPRADVPDVTVGGEARIVPLRLTASFGVADGDPDPRGLPVIGGDGATGGVVTDLWVDRAEAVFRYLEVAPDDGSPAVLIPLTFACVDRRRVRVDALMGGQLKRAPRTVLPDRVTLLEEEKIAAFCGAGTLYATPARQEPLL